MVEARHGLNYASTMPWTVVNVASEKPACFRWNKKINDVGN